MTGETYKVGSIFIHWIPVGTTHGTFTNKGNYPLVWITPMEGNPLKILIASVRASTKTIANAIKRTLAYGGQSIKGSENEKITQWIKTKRCS